MYAIINESHAPITKSQYSSELKFLIDELLNKNPDRRPSIEELIDEPIIKSAIDALVNEF
jgi:serine/threonine protein kinase